MIQAHLICPGKIELKDVPIPEPEEGEVLIKVKNALTCGTDLKAYLRGHHVYPMPGPFGHEYSGIVVKSRNPRFKEGDPVMGVNSAPCLGCAYCKRGLFNLCENLLQSMVRGAYAEYLLIPRDVANQNLFIKPEEITFQKAPFLEPLSAVVHPYRRHLIEAEKALVIGAGVIGLLHMLLLRSKGMDVTIMDINNERLLKAKELGVSRAILPTEIKQSISDVTSGFGFDLVVECTGQVSVWQESLDYVRKGGTVILFGGCKKGTSVNFDTYRIHYDEITLLGTFHFTPEDVREALKILPKVDAQGLISEELRLKDIKKAFDLLSKGKGLKYLISP